MDNANELARLVEEAVTKGISSTSWIGWLLLFTTAAGACIGTFVASYLKRKGENIATKEDFNILLEQVRQTTRVTEEIKGQHALIVAKMHVNAAVLSGNRQEWINTLRDQISEFLSVTQTMNLATQVGMLTTKEDILPKVERALFLQSKISLLINPKEGDHADLVNLIDEAMKEMAQMKASPGKVSTSPMALLRRKITDLSQQILKREWEQVKAGK